MGPIQSSINNLVGTAWGTVAGMAVGIKKFGKELKKPEKPKETEKPKAETTGSMGNIVQIRPIKRAAHYAAIGQESAQGMILEKAGSANFSVEERVKQAQTASAFTVAKKEDKK